MLTIYSLYTHLLFTSLIFSLLLVILTFKHRKNKITQGILGIVTIAMGVQGSMLFSMFSSNLAWAAWWHGNIRLGVYAFIPLAGYAFTDHFINPQGKTITRQTAWILVFPFITLLFGLTNDWHHLFISSYGMELRQGFFIRTAWQPGIWFWVHTLYSYIVSLMILWLLGRWIHQTRRLPRLRGILMVSVVVLAVGSISLDTFGIILAPGLLLLPLIFWLVDILLLLGIWQLDLLDILPVARETLIRHMADAIFIVDPQNIILDANPAAEKIVGHPVAEIIGKDMIQFVLHPERAQPTHGILTDEFRGVMPLAVKGLDHFFDVRVTDIYIEKAVVGARLVVFRDVTPFQNSEAAVRASQERLALALKAGSMGVWDWDFNRQTTRWDEQMFSIYGLPGPEITHEQWQQLVLPEDLPQAEVQTQAFNPANAKHVTEFRIRRPDGAIRRIQSVAQGIFKDGKLDQMVGINLDVTERKELQQRELELATLEERQRLARDLHDAVSQTLFSARLTSEMLLRQKNRLTPETIWAHIEHLTRLIVSALGEMRILLLELRPEGLENAELPALLTHLADALGSRTEAPIQLKLLGQRKLPVNVKIALYRIAQEALNNIIKHARATELSLELQLDTAGATLVVADNGRGFDQQRLPGGQLGLGIMRERAAEIGARLEIASQPEGGTRVSCVWKE